MDSLNRFARAPLDGTIRLGYWGDQTVSPGLLVSAVRDLSIATIIARRGLLDQVISSLDRHFWIDARLSRTLIQSDLIDLVCSSPGQWLAISSKLDPDQLYDELSSKLGDHASISDQSDGRAIVRLCGDKVRHVLTKLVPIDLHPTKFSVGTVASTVAHHINVQLWQRDAKPTYDLSVARSLAPDLWRLLMEAAAEYGCHVSD